MVNQIGSFSRGKSRHLIGGKSTATRGTNYDDIQSQKQIKRRLMMAELLSGKNLYEKIWYTFFIVVSLLCLILIRPITYPLVFAFVSFWIYMVAENLQAKGKSIGFLFSIISVVLYVVDCIIFQVYGEVVINLLVYTPIYIYSYIQYRRCQIEEGAVKFLGVRKLKLIYFVLLLLLLGVVGFGFGYVLNLFGSAYAYVNAYALGAFLIGMILNSQRCIETWVFDFIGNAFTLTLWICVSSGTFDSIPFVLSTVAAICNNVYAVIIWSKLYKKSAPTRGVILNKRPINIVKVIKLKRRLKGLKWNREVDERKNMKNNNF